MSFLQSKPDEFGLIEVDLVVEPMKGKPWQSRNIFIRKPDPSRPIPKRAIRQSDFNFGDSRHYPPSSEV
jgi:hypothetical protein